MSQAYMEENFPLAEHGSANDIKNIVKGSLYTENADPAVGDWSEEALIYVRSDGNVIQKELADLGIVLTEGEVSDLITFASEYASEVDQEEDIAQTNALRIEGENDV